MRFSFCIAGSVALNYAPKAHTESEVEIRQPILRLRSSGERVGRHGKKVQKVCLMCAKCTLKRAKKRPYIIHSDGDTSKVRGTPRFFCLFAGISEVRTQHCESDKANPVESGSDGFNSD